MTEFQIYIWAESPDNVLHSHAQEDKDSLCGESKGPVKEPQYLNKFQVEKIELVCAECKQILGIV